jgi:Ran GTPase-activating protein (RanGAP) involved in mRNA processing and transport
VRKKSEEAHAHFDVRKLQLALFMQPFQLTNDAGYKFELWRKLLGESFEVSPNDEPCVPASVQAALRRVALPVVQSHLPRRVREPCCLAGSCATPNIPFLHRCVHLGRSRVETVESCRDELCFCLAHSTACAGPGVDLVVRGYYSSGNDMRSRHRGLRCLLQHTHARSIRFENVDNHHDTREIVGEVSYLLQRLQPHSCWRELHLTHCSMTPNSFRGLLTSLRRYDTLTHVSLEGCHVGSSAIIGEYVSSTTSLTHLSLRGTTMARDWASVGRAVALASSVEYLDVSACNWQDTPHLSEFITSLSDFVQRPRFGVNLSANLLTSKCFSVLAAGSAKLLACVTDLYLGGHRFTEDEEPLSQLLSAYSQLDSLSLSRCTLSAGVAQRVLRALGDKKKVWRLVDVSHTNIPAGSFKRICQAAFAAGASSLYCSGVDMHGQITKVGFASCAAVLSRLELSRCSLTDDCVEQLASALEKGAPLPLRHLSLGHNAVDKGRTKGDGSFLFLCKALRSHNAPSLETLDLSGNKLPILPIVAFVEQAASTVSVVDFSYTSIADSSADRVRVMTTLMRRQRSASPFRMLDIFLVSSVDEAWSGMKEVTDWLATQTSVHLETHAVCRTGSRMKRN